MKENIYSFFSPGNEPGSSRFEVLGRGTNNKKVGTWWKKVPYYTHSTDNRDDEENSSLILSDYIKDGF